MTSRELLLLRHDGVTLKSAISTVYDRHDRVSPVVDFKTTSMAQSLQRLPFEPITAQNIMNCSYHAWYPLFRSLTPKARMIPLSDAFVAYLKADGIILTSDAANNDDDSDYYSDTEDEDPSEQWADVHIQVKEVIRELGGKVVPKLNWSAPKDATFMSATRDMECQNPNDIYLLLKSSDFVTHDLEHAFDYCKDSLPIPFHLILRKSFQLNPSLEFRCFVRNRKLIGITQREMQHFSFLAEMRSTFLDLIEDFLENLKSFADDNFVFDVYIPPPHERVWLIDINPWAPSTDPLLFSWLELLQMDIEEDFLTELRLVGRDDPESYQFSSTKYSAHKLPKEVVDATQAGGNMKDLMEEWKKALDKQVEEDDED